MKNRKVTIMVSIGMLSSIAYLLMFLQFPLPLFPNFLFVDFSDIPPMIAVILFGPAAGIIVELIKNILNYFATGSPTGIPLGQIANFLAGIFFMLPAYYLYRKLKTRKGMTLALICGTLTMAMMMSVLNYFIFLPAYTALLKFPDLRNLVVPAILPFNIIKGIMMSVIFMLLFVRMEAWMKRFSLSKDVNKKETRKAV